MEARKVAGARSDTKVPGRQERSIVERLLLSVIDANPGPEAKASGKSRDVARERRLGKAMSALFNVGTTAKGEQVQTDSYALWWMASEHHKDLVKKNVVEAADSNPFAKFNRGRTGGQYPPRSDRQLALDAAKHLHGPIDKNALSDLDLMKSVAERLRKKWAQQREYWMDHVRYSDDLDENDDMHILVSIWTTLQTAGIETVPNWTDGTPIGLALAERMGIPKLAELVIARQKAGARIDDIEDRGK